jgi:hypothetical protein
VNVEELLSRLEGVRRSGAGGWRARCPVHGSRGPTLSIAEGDSGVVLHCFAGCETADVLAEIGLAWTDVFDDDEPGPLPPSARVLGRQPTAAEWEATWRRLRREADRRTDAYSDADEPPLPRPVRPVRPIVPKGAEDYVAAGGERRRLRPPLTRSDLDDDDETFAAYDAWRQGDGRLPPR